MKNIILLPMAILLLASCGFQLKGLHENQTLAVRHWQISGQSLQSALETAMRQAQANLQPFSGSPEAEIRVLNVDSKKDVYTITRGAKLNEYLLSLRVTAQAFRHGQTWGQPIRVNVRRTMPYSDSMVLGKAEEENIIWQEMHQDAAEQIVRQLAFLSDYPSTSVGLE